VTTPESSNPRTPRGAVWAVRRALAPGALELEGVAIRLTAENAGLRAEVEELRQRLGSTEERLGREIAELKDGLHEARRLNLRIAELTDLVTELVLPLHDREIDPAALAKLRPDTL
jgi:predicted RNase H-like nuclease (RuvC/YqgF family)